MKKKFGAIFILFFILASNLVPFFSANAQDPDPNDDSFFQSLFSGSLVTPGLPNADFSQIGVYTTIKTDNSAVESGFNWKTYLLGVVGSPIYGYYNALYNLTFAPPVGTQKNFLFIDDLPNWSNVGEDTFSDGQFILKISEENSAPNSIPFEAILDISGQVHAKSPKTTLFIHVPSNADLASGKKLKKDGAYTIKLYYKAACDSTCAHAETILGNKKYYPIATSLVILNDAYVASTTDNMNSNPSNYQENVAPEGSGSMPECWTGLTGSIFSVSGCVAQLTYYALFVPTSFIFGLTGELLDFSMKYTTDSDSYGGTKGSFVNEGWKITRDLANIAFIFILLYTAIGTILNLHAVDWKKTLARVIIIGLLINFSLFAAKVVIDSGNILARIFYSSIGVTTTDDTNTVSVFRDSDTKSVSVAIVSKFNPQSLFTDALTQTHSVSGVTGVQDDQTTNVKAPAAGWFTIITLIMVVLNLIGIYVFFVVGFLFLARTAGLWILMIFAPIAFVSFVIPSGHGDHGGGGHGSKGMEFMNWKGWWDSLLKQSFVVPIFLFFMYLILKFLNTGFLKSNLLSGGSWGSSILQVAVPLLIVAILLLKAKDIATSMSGVVAEYAVKAATFAGGLAGGAMLGGAALGASKLASSTLGKLSTEEAKDRAAGKSGTKWQQFVARKQVAIGETSKNRSFDFRKTQAGALMAKQSGFNFDNSALALAGIGTENLKGGAVGRAARVKIEKAAKADKYGYNKEKFEALEEAEKANKKDFEKSDEEYKKSSDTARLLERERKLDQTAFDADPKKVQALKDALAENKKHMEDRNHYAHEAHEIANRKENVKNDRKDYMAAKEEQKGGVVKPTRVVADLKARADMTLPDGTRIREGEVIVKKGQQITNAHLKSIMRELKNAGHTPDQIAEQEEFFKQFETKSNYKFNVRDSKTGVTSTVNVPPNQYSPGQVEGFMKQARDGGASTVELDNLKKNFNYIAGQQEKRTQQVYDAVNDFAKGFAGGAVAGSFVMPVIGTLGGGIAGGLANVLSNFTRDFGRYSEKGAKAFGSAIRNGVSAADQKYAINSAAKAPTEKAKHDDHGGGGAHH